jgi:hypothetical protein
MLLAGIQETNTEHFTHIKHVTITQQRIAVISHGRYEVSFSLPAFVSFNLYNFLTTFGSIQGKHSFWGL